MLTEIELDFFLLLRTRIIIIRQRPDMCVTCVPSTRFFFRDPVVSDSICYRTRANLLINERNTTGGLRKFGWALLTCIWGSHANASIQLYHEKQTPNGRHMLQLKCMHAANCSKLNSQAVNTHVSNPRRSFVSSC